MAARAGWIRYAANSNTGGIFMSQASPSSPLRVGGLLYPNFELLDLFGPLEMFSLLGGQRAITDLGGRLAPSLAGLALAARIADIKGGGWDVQSEMIKDRKTGKHTLVAIFGKGFGQWQYITSITLATLAPLPLYLMEQERIFVLLASLTFLMALYAIQKTLHFSPGGAVIMENSAVVSNRNHIRIRTSPYSVKTGKRISRQFSFRPFGTIIMQNCPIQSHGKNVCICGSPDTKKVKACTGFYLRPCTAIVQNGTMVANSKHLAPRTYPYVIKMFIEACVCL